jgi:hypothetical protein
MTEKKTTRTLKADTAPKSKRLCNGTYQLIDAEKEVLMYLTNLSQRA